MNYRLALNFMIDVTKTSLIPICKIVKKHALLKKRYFYELLKTNDFFLQFIRFIYLFSNLFMNQRAGMTLESMAAQIVHQLNPSGSHVTYDQLRQFIGQNYDRDRKF